MKQITMTDAESDRLPSDPDDFDWVVAHHQKRIFRTLLCLVRDVDAAEVLTQECFLRAFRKRNTFRGESSLGTWLMSIAVNLAHDHNKNHRWAFWRRLMRVDSLEQIHIADAGRSPELVIIERELVDAIQYAVQRLPERQKAAFLLRFVEDMPLEDIAEVLALELGTVKSHLHRATEAVRKTCIKQGIRTGQLQSPLE